MNLKTFILFLMITLASCYYPPVQNKYVIPKYKSEYNPKRSFYYHFQSYSNDVPKLPYEYTDNISNDIAQFYTHDIPKRYFNYLPKASLNRKRWCPHSTICDSVDNYPSHLIQWHLKKNPTHVERLLKKSDHVPVTINRRIGIGGSDTKDTEMCKSRKEIIRPTAGLTKDNIWKHVFNNGEYGIEAVFCENPGGNCTMDLPEWKMTCEQKYIYKVLVSLDGYVTTTDEFKVPSGCICKYKQA